MLKSDRLRSHRIWRGRWCRSHLSGSMGGPVQVQLWALPWWNEERWEILWLTGSAAKIVWQSHTCVTPARSDAEGRFWGFIKDQGKGGLDNVWGISTIHSHWIFGKENWANEYHCQIHSLLWTASSSGSCRRVKQARRVVTREESWWRPTTLSQSGDPVMDKNRQPGNSSFLECFVEVPENLNPAFSAHPSIKHSDSSLECARMDDILARTLLYLGLRTLARVVARRSRITGSFSTFKRLVLLTDWRWRFGLGLGREISEEISELSG